jgi:hypothetical protein
MKNLPILLPLMGCFLSLSGQTLSPEIISSSGGYFENTNASLSWTLGETATETLVNGNIILTQGFQQPVSGIIISGIDLDLLLFLEGPYNGLDMTPVLNTLGLIPLSQPFNQSPWNYAGDESVVSIPNPDVVDWILIELRDAPNAVSADANTVLDRQAAFLLRDGSVVATDGSSVLQFDNSFNQQLFVVAWHRNHLGMMSANGVTLNGDVYAYDFSVSETQVHGGSNGHKDLGGGVWGMAAGDANHDRIIDFNDKALWAVFAGEAGYFGADLNLDGQTDNSDKNEAWKLNLNMSSQAPE